MATEQICGRCKGAGSYDALVSQHDDEKETITCTSCKGKGKTYMMTDEEEQDYHDDYW